MPQPRLIDPAVFFDIVKIRRAVDEATEDAVRASTGIGSMQSTGSRYDPFGGGGAQGPKMSKERIHKVRQKAVKLLAKAYTLDEVAASVATMQSTSSLEDVAQHVLKRDKADHEARYVHFFHEKIPSRMMEQYTPLTPLTEIIQTLPLELQAAPLRTRGIIQIFKADYERAAGDFTLALQIAQELKLRHKPGADQLVLAREFKEERDKWNKSGRDWRSVPQLKDDEQPSSMEQQILFNRAGVYLTLACQHVHSALDGLSKYQQKLQQATNGAGSSDDVSKLSAADRLAQQKRLDARKIVKTYAKRALKDYMAFLSSFDYTPGLPFEVTNEIMRRVYDLANGNRTQTMTPRERRLENGSSHASTDSTKTQSLVKHQKPNNANGSRVEWDSDGWPKFPRPQIHPASALFAEKPPPGLPDFPDTPTSLSRHQHRPTDPLSLGSREALTYHPLLTDALHSLLLSHALLQTSPTELQRHAHNAARLARIADGYPIFQAARSPSRADWIEVLRRANNWIGLTQSWQKLCQPAPLPTAAGGDLVQQHNSDPRSGTEEGREADVLRERVSETEAQKRERIKQQAILDALGDERVVDEESFQRAVQARERRALQDEESVEVVSDPVSLSSAPGLSNVSKTDSPTVHANGSGRQHQHQNQQQQQPQPQRWAQDDASKEYPISTERADAIARWIREAPLSVAGAKKKRPARKKNGSDKASETGGVESGSRDSPRREDGDGVDTVAGAEVASTGVDAGLGRAMKALRVDGQHDEGRSANEDGEEVD